MMPRYPAAIVSGFVGKRVPSVDRALDMLELIACSSRGLTLAEISRALGLAKSSAHNLIGTLLARGCVYRDLDGHHYLIGFGLSAFANAVAAHKQLSAICLPFLQALERTLQLTAQTAVLNGAEGIIISKAESPHNVGSGTWLGRHFDLHCTAQGKALIAHLPDPELEQLFRYRGFARFTPKTICSLEELKADLAEVRARGYALNNQEHILGLTGVAAPVFNHIGTTIASVSVRGSSHEQLPSWRIPHVADEVIAATRQISRQLTSE